MQRIWILGLSILLIGLNIVGDLHATDWPQWRGAEGDGISPESSGWPEAWPPTRLWSANVGVGCTSPIIAGGRLYVLGWKGKDGQKRKGDGVDTLWCLDAATGAELWSQSYPSPYHTGACATGMRTHTAGLHPRRPWIQRQAICTRSA